MAYIIAAVLTLGAVNPIYGYTCYGILIVFAAQAIKRKRILLNALGGASFWWLLTFCTAYMFFCCISTGYGLPQALLAYCIAPILTYLAGWTLIEMEGEPYEKVLFRMLLAMTIGFSIHATLNYFTNIGHSRWMITDFFTGRIRSATGLGSINTFVYSLIGYWLFVEKSIKGRIAAIVLSVPSLLFGLLLGTRTQFLILFVTLLLALLLIGFETRPQTAVFKIVGIVALIIGVSIALYQTNVMNIRTIIESSALFARIHDTSRAQRGSDSYRFNVFFEGVGAILEYSFGGNPHSYYHNMWLDVARIAGIFPFFAILIFTIKCMVSAIQLFLNRQTPARYRYPLLLIYVGIYMNFFVEPIIEGFMDFFLAFVLIAGMVDAYRKYSVICDQES